MMNTATGNTPANDMNTMSTLIRQHLSDPPELERLFRADTYSFKKAFQTLYPDIKDHLIVQVWQERLKTSSEGIAWGRRGEWKFLACMILLAGLLLKIPDFTGIDQEFFYSRNLAFAAFPMIAAFFLWKQSTPFRQIAFPLLVFVLSALYINALPADPQSDTLTLACIHLPILLWITVGYTFPGNHGPSYAKRLGFLRFNGDLVVLCTLMGLSGMLFMAITMGLFKVLGVDIASFAGHYLAPWGAPAIPILATFLVHHNPRIVSRISPLIARIFTPLIFIMLLLFLGALLYTGKDPYNDREFLLIFNALLLGVMAVILFSLSGAGKLSPHRGNILMLLGLALLTIIANGIALSAISFRIFEYGISPNRLAVLGSNILIFFNLIRVAWQLFRTTRGTSGIDAVEAVIAAFIPLYAGWAFLVAFGFPVFFGMK